MDKKICLGDRLRHLRSERHLSQHDLSGLAGISTNSISLIERDEISPSVSTLQSLAGALNIKVSYFFDDEHTGNVLLVKGNERPIITGNGLIIEGIGKRLQGQEVEPFLVTLEPHANSGERQVMHPGQEFIWCQEGKVEYLIDKQSYVVEKGDFLIFEATLPHIWRNPFDQRALFILVIQTPNESLDTVQRHFVDFPSIKHIG
ncbi:MAG: cupin domain-containing protein [Chloroflexota bacterium]